MIKHYILDRPILKKYKLSEISNFDESYGLTLLKNGNFFTLP